MAQPVWVLSVDLQTQTATFQSGMAEAAKSARGAFTDIKRSAGEMSEGTSRGFGDIRHSLGLLDNSIRGQHGAAMADAIRLTAQFVDVSAALPYAAITGGFLLIAGGVLEVIKKFQEYRQQAEATRNANLEFGTAVDNVYNGLTEKLLQAGIKADELNKDHLAALHKQLELIDLQTMSDLVHSFDAISKASDKVFGELKANWYTLGIGSAGAQHALTEFKVQYDSLLAQGKDKDAADLLAGTRASAEHVLELQKRLKLESRGNSLLSGPNTDYFQAIKDKQELQKAGVGYSDKELASQQALVAALEAQESVQERINVRKDLQKGNATRSTGNAIAGDTLARFRQEAEAERRAQEDQLQMESSAHQKAVAALQESEREKIEAVQRGSSERLAAIAAALKEEEAYGLQETDFYRQLSRQKVQIITQMAAEQEKLSDEAAKEATDHDLKMRLLQAAAQRESQQLADNLHRASIQQRAKDEIDAANAEYSAKMKAYSRDIAALNQHDADYQNKLKALQNKETELTQQHGDQITLIKAKAAAEQEQQQRQALARMETGFANSFLSVLEHHQSFAGMMAGLSQQIVSNIISEAIAEKNGLDSTKMDEAKAAARKMYLAGSKFPWPMNIVMAPTLAAMGFAAMMAFEGGGIVPGVGKGDIVPAMLSPGEAVINKKLTEGLTRAADSGSMGRGNTNHIHYRPTFHVQAIDRSGVQEMLDNHTAEFERHAEKMLRNLNRG